MRFFIFLLGLAVGSFLNAYIWRSRPHPALSLEERGWGEGSVWRGRSQCPKCKKTLSWYELIPVLSFIIQLGRCRGCKQKIDWQYPLGELATGVLFVLGAGKWDASNFAWQNLEVSLFSWYLLSVLVVLFIFDLRYGLVPDRVVLPAIVVGAVYTVIPSVARNLFTIIEARDRDFSASGLEMTLWRTLLAIVVGAGFFALQYYLSKGKWLGAGDIRIGALMGAMLGWPLIIEALVLSYMIGGAVGLLLIATGRKRFGQTVPLGTFLTLGTAVTFLYGEQIWQWYWR